MARGWLRRRRTFFRRSLVYVDSVAIIATVVAGTALAADQVGIWHKATYRQLLFCVVVCISAGLYAEIQQLTRRVLQPRRVNFREDVGDVLLTALDGVAALTDIKHNALGVSAFRITGRGKSARLQRIGRRRLSAHPGRSDIEWTCGKGVIGTCWQTRRAEFRDLRAVARQHKDVVEANYQSVPVGTRMGLEWKDFQAIIGKYAGVLAVPMTDAEGKLIGVVAVDVDLGRQDDARLVNRLDKAGVKGVVSGAAETIANLLKSARAGAVP